MHVLHRLGYEDSVLSSDLRGAMVFANMTRNKHYLHEAGDLPGGANTILDISSKLRTALTSSAWKASGKLLLRTQTFAGRQDAGPTPQPVCCSLKSVSSRTGFQTVSGGRHRHSYGCIHTKQDLPHKVITGLHLRKSTMNTIALHGMQDLVLVCCCSTQVAALHKAAD